MRSNLPSQAAKVRTKNLSQQLTFLHNFCNLFYPFLVSFSNITGDKEHC